MKRIVIAPLIAILICLLLISCSSGSGVASSRYYYNSYYGHSTYSGGSHYTYHPYDYQRYVASRGYYYPYTITPARQVTGLTTTRSVPSTYTDIQKIMDTCGKVLDPGQYGIEYGYIPLEPRITNVDAENFSLASTNVDYDPADEDPTIRLASTTYTVSIAVYHFTSIPAGDTITSISIDNLSKFYGPDSHGFFLGYRPNEDADYSWFGPYTSNSSWLLPLNPVQTMEPTNPSLAVVVTNGDVFDFRSFTVNIENYWDAKNRLRLEQEEYERQLYQLQLERNRLDWEQQQLYYEWQRLEDEYRWMRQQQRSHHHRNWTPDHVTRPDKPDRSRLIEVTEDENPVKPTRVDLAPPKG